VALKSSVFWDITPCGALKVKRPFGGTKEKNSAGYLLHAGFLLALFFDPVDGDDMFLRNVG
jgi:hypothetical protein